MKSKRLKEPSTWAGIGLILSAIAPVLPLAYATPVGALIGVLDCAFVNVKCVHVFYSTLWAALCFPMSV